MAQQHECTDTNCPPDCAWIFERIRVMPHILGGTRVEWFMHPDFLDPLPHTFQLQVNHSSAPTADDWEDVGPEAVNTWFLVDDQQRVHGTAQWTHYRIKLTTDVGTYYSKLAPSLGVWDFLQWRRAQAIIRAELKVMQFGHGGQDGYLVKRRVSGVPCRCLDVLTDEVRNAQCPLCYGVGWTGGYYEAIDCLWALISEDPEHARIEPDGPRGQSGSIVAKARMLATPQLNELDVWVDKNSDMRYFVHTIKSAVEIRGVPIVYDPVELRLAPFTDQIYQFPIPNQIPE